MVKRIYGLDILRAIAILLVIYAHWIVHVGLEIFNLGDGVAIFFVLSGFLIGKILFGIINKRFEFRDLFNFWIRRWFRTLPAYFFVVGLIMIFTHEFHLSYFVFAQNLFTANLTFYRESWSLSIEEWFYLLIPLLFFISVKFFHKKILLVCVLLIIVSVSILRMLYTHSGMSLAQFNISIRTPVIMRLDSIMYGVLAAYISTYYKTLWTKLSKFFFLGPLLWSVIVLNMNTFGLNWFALYLVLPAQSLATFLVIPFLSTVKTGSGKVFKFFTFVSTISYSMYLLNATPVNVILGIDRVQLYTNEHRWIEFLIYMIISFPGAYLLHISIEKPFMNLRDKFILNKIHLKYWSKKEQLVKVD